MRHTLQLDIVKMESVLLSGQRGSPMSTSHLPIGSLSVSTSKSYTRILIGLRTWSARYPSKCVV